MPRILLLVLLLLAFFIHVPIRNSMAADIIVPINHFPPWKITNTGNIEGININLTRRLLSRIGEKPVFISRPWKRCLTMMKKGQADLMNGILKRPEREEYLIFLEPPYKTKSTKAFYVLKGKSSLIKQYEDLQNLNIGTTLGSKFFHRFDDDTTLKKEIVKNNDLNIKKLIAGRIDTFIATETVADYQIAQKGLQDQIEKAEFIYSYPISVYFAVAKSSPLAKRIPELSAALKDMVDSGEVDSIILTFISSYPPVPLQRLTSIVNPN